MVGAGKCSGTSRRDPPGLGQAERLREFPRRLGQFPSSFLTKPRWVHVPPVTSAPVCPTTCYIRKFRMSPFLRPLTPTWGFPY